MMGLDEIIAANKNVSGDDEGPPIAERKLNVCVKALKLVEGAVNVDFARLAASAALEVLDDVDNGVVDAAA